VQEKKQSAAESSPEKGDLTGSIGCSWVRLLSRTAPRAGQRESYTPLKQEDGAKIVRSTRGEGSTGKFNVVEGPGGRGFKVDGPSSHDSPCKDQENSDNGVSKEMPKDLIQRQ